MTYEAFKGLGVSLVDGEMASSGHLHLSFEADIKLCVDIGGQREKMNRNEGYLFRYLKKDHIGARIRPVERFLAQMFTDPKMIKAFFSYCRFLKEEDPQNNLFFVDVVEDIFSRIIQE